MCNSILVLGKSFFLPMIILSLVHPIFLVLFSLPHQPQTNLHLLKIRICYNYRYHIYYIASLSVRHSMLDIFVNAPYQVP